MEIDKIKIYNTQYDIASKGSVRYDASQSLTDGQKARARLNIGSDNAVTINTNQNNISGNKSFTGDVDFSNAVSLAGGFSVDEGSAGQFAYFTDLVFIEEGNDGKSIQDVIESIDNRVIEGTSTVHEITNSATVHSNMITDTSSGKDYYMSMAYSPSDLKVYLKLVGDVINFSTEHTDTQAIAVESDISTYPHMLKYYANKHIFLDNLDDATKRAPIYCSECIETSDLNLKDNIAVITDENLEKIDKIELKLFNFKSNPGSVHYGIIAQDLLKAGLDNIVSDVNGILAVNYNDILILKLASAEKKIKELEARLEALENKLK